MGEKYLFKESLLYIDQTWDQNQCWVMIVYSSEGLGSLSTRAICGPGKPDLRDFSYGTKSLLKGYAQKTIEERHALKSLFVGFNEVFFERCGVATGDQINYYFIFMRFSRIMGSK